MAMEHSIFDRHARQNTFLKVRTIQNPKLTCLAWFDRDLSDHAEDGPTKCRIYMNIQDTNMLNTIFVHNFGFHHDHDYLHLPPHSLGSQANILF